ISRMPSCASGWKRGRGCPAISRTTRSITRVRRKRPPVMPRARSARRRPDSYIDQFQAAGGSMISLAKGNRSAQVRDACKKHGGFYLASIGGSAANLGEHCIKKVEVIEYAELGMEAI